SGLVVTYSGADPVKTQRMVEETVSHITEGFQRDQRARCDPSLATDACGVSTGELGFKLDVLKAASLPEDADFPALPLAIGGAALGLFAFVFINRRRLSDTLRGATRNIPAVTMPLHKLAIGLGTAGALVGIVLAWRAPATYEASANVRIVVPNMP